ncbi:MAG: precorrin-3B C(17)-methyltransferase [Cyanobacteriota bacterium]|nr:precorrin-3B C(17)-methyltransferase [Cyanobacteriota bacterium]
MIPAPQRIVGLGFSPDARPLLEQLLQAGAIGSLRLPGAAEDPAAWLLRQWSTAEAVVAVGACGLVVRLIAPLLRGKTEDPAVVVLDPLGRFAVPLLGGHAAGGEALAQRLAALLGGQAAITGSATASARLPLDAFGEAWGWQRGAGDWTRLMQEAASRPGAAAAQAAGIRLWRELAAPAADAEDSGSAAPGIASLRIDHRLGEGCRWHPPVLWLGMGCERGSSESLLERLVQETLAEAGLAAAAVAGIASVELKADEAALLAVAARHGWPLRLFSAAELATVAVPNPSERVARELGTASVAEASSLLAAEAAAAAALEESASPAPPLPGDPLLVPKRIARAAPGEQGAATLAVALARRQWAPQRGELHLVGSGPGRLDLLSGDARQALARATVWVGYGPYLDLLEPLRRPDQLRRDGRLTAERDRCLEALDLAGQGLRVALVSSGDSGIYGMAGLALELWLARPPIDRPAFTVHPGISALQLAAARAGAPLMHDFCTISLSDRLTPWEVIERRLRAAAAGDFVVALYNPRSLGRDWQLERARSLLLEGRPASTPVAVARQLGRTGESVRLFCLGDLPVEEVDMLTLVLIGNSTTRMVDGRMVTPRGYPGARLA